MRSGVLVYHCGARNQAAQAVTQEGVAFKGLSTYFFSYSQVIGHHLSYKVPHTQQWLQSVFSTKLLHPRGSEVNRLQAHDSFKSAFSCCETETAFLQPGISDKAAFSVPLASTSWTPFLHGTGSAVV
jgi:hypothetical protein